MYHRKTLYLYKINFLLPFPECVFRCLKNIFFFYGIYSNKVFTELVPRKGTLVDRKWYFIFLFIILQEFKTNLH